MTSTEIAACISASGVVLAAIIGALALLLVRVQHVHVLVNSNLTAVTAALARKTEQVAALESENAMLRGEPASTLAAAAQATP